MIHLFSVIIKRRLNLRKGEEVKDNTRIRTSRHKVAVDVFVLEVRERFLHHDSSQVWCGVPVSHGNKITARWFLMVLIKGIIKQLVCSKFHAIAFPVLLLCEKVRYKL